MVPGRHIRPRTRPQDRIRRLAPCALALGLALWAVGSPAEAAELTLSWVDNSGGAASSRVERKAGVGGAYAELTTQPPGVTSYTDTAVATGMTYCYRVQAYNAAGASAFSNEDCSTIVASTFNLTVALAGTGTGVVSSSPSGIACGTDCVETYPSGTAVTLTATPAWGSVFAGWSGGGCSGTGACTVTGNVAVTVSATFAAQTFALTVSRTGNGTVTSSPAGVSCGTDCSESYASGTTVTLTAAPAAGNVFSGWSGGGCSGTGTCTVSLTSAVTVTATFATQTFALTVSRTGNGTVASSPAGISCGTDCSESYASGTTVTLTAAPAAGNVFTGWSGGGCSGTGTCSVSITSALTVAATFATAPNYTLTVDRSGPGSVSGTGIACGNDCAQTFPAGTVVTLTATPGRNAVFAGWSGACSGTGPCTVALTQNTTLKATFRGGK